MSKQCPITHQHCHDPLCEGDLCQIDYQRGKQKYDAPEMGKPKSEEYWDKVMEKLAANPFNQHSPEGRNEFWQVINKQMEIMGDLAQALNKPIFIDIDEPEHHHKPANKPIFVLSTIIDNQTFIMADIQLTFGATPKGPGIFSLFDSVTNALITGGTFSSQVIGANSNPGVATFAFADATNNSVTPTPLAAGTGTIAFSTLATYVDSTGATQTNVAFSIVKNFTVQLGADGVNFDVVFP